VFAWYNHKPLSSEMTKEIFMYNTQGMLSLAHSVSGSRKGKKLDVQGSVIKVFNQKGITPIGLIGRRVARKLVIETERKQRIAALCSRA
jgi:hypothetical protein